MNRFTEKDEIKRHLVPQECSTGSVLYADAYGKYVYPGSEHMIVLGSTRTGKSQTVYLPTLRSIISNGESFISMETKGEPYEQTSCYVTDEYEKILIDFTNPFQSTRWNLLDPIRRLLSSNSIEDRDDGMMMAKDIADCFCEMNDKDPFWPESSRTIIKGAILALCELYNRGLIPAEEVNMRSVFEIICSGRESMMGNSCMDQLITILGKKSIAADELAQFAKAPGDTASSMQAVAMQDLRKALSSKGIQRMLCTGDDMDLLNLGRTNRPLAIYTILPSETGVYNKIAAALVSQLMTQLFRAARTLKDNRITPRLHLLLDELGNMAAIENLPRYVTECASRNITIMMCLQSLEQLNHLYGDSRATTIIDSVDIFVTFRINSIKTMNWISERVGRISKNSPRPLIMPEAIGMLENGQALISIRGRIKYVTRLPYYWKSYDHTGWQPVRRIPYRGRDVHVPVINLRSLCIEHQRKQHEEALKKLMQTDDTKKPAGDLKNSSANDRKCVRQQQTNQHAAGDANDKPQ